MTLKPIHGLPALLCLCLLSSEATAETRESMTQMPLVKAKRVFTATGHEDLKTMQGFGADEPQVRMMNLMMVEGPPPPERKDGLVVNPSPFDIQAKLAAGSARVGKQALELTVLDAKTREPVPGLQLHLEVFMTSMDMGTAEAAAQETSPGHYRAEVSFEMAGPWAIRVRSTKPSERSREWENVLKFDVKS